MSATRQQNGWAVGTAAGSAAIAAMALTLPGLAQSSGGIEGVLAPGVAPELVREGFVFTEGPVGTAEGGLYFSDIRANKTYYLDPSGKISELRQGPTAPMASR